MAESIGYKEINKARRNHVCFWCGESIPKGTSYTRWIWVDASEFDQIKVHPECAAAWSRASDQEGYPYETMPYEHQRGLTVNESY